MRKYISIILIFTFLINIEGSYLIFNIFQYKIQREIKLRIRKGLKDGDLSLIIVPIDNESAIQWIKPDKEFRYKGEMYDIVRMKVSNHKKHYYCINDIKEKKLVDNYNKTHNTKKESEKRIKKVFSHKLFFQKACISNYLSSLRFCFVTGSFRLITNYLLIPSPPPEFV